MLFEISYEECKRWVNQRGFFPGMITDIIRDGSKDLLIVVVALDPHAIIQQAKSVVRVFVPEQIHVHLQLRLESLKTPEGLYELGVRFCNFRIDGIRFGVSFLINQLEGLVRSKIVSIVLDKLRQYSIQVYEDNDGYLRMNLSRLLQSYDSRFNLTEFRLRFYEDKLSGMIKIM